MDMQEHKTAPDRIIVEIFSHKTLDMWLATSPNLPGLQVTGSSMEEVYERAPEIISAMIEFQTGEAVQYELAPEDGKVPTGFAPHAFIARAASERA